MPANAEDSKSFRAKVRLAEVDDGLSKFSMLHPTPTEADTCVYQQKLVLGS